MLKKLAKESKQPNDKDASVSVELKRLADFFSILIAIDQRTKNNSYVKTK